MAFRAGPGGAPVLHAGGVPVGHRSFVPMSAMSRSAGEWLGCPSPKEALRRFRQRPGHRFDGAYQLRGIKDRAAECSATVWPVTGVWGTETDKHSVLYMSSTCAVSGYLSTDGFMVTGCYGMVVAADGSVAILADLRRRWPAGLAGIAAVKVGARLRCCGGGCFARHRACRRLGGCGAVVRWPRAALRVLLVRAWRRRPRRRRARRRRWPGSVRPGARPGPAWSPGGR